MEKNHIQIRQFVKQMRPVCSDSSIQQNEWKKNGNIHQKFIFVEYERGCFDNWIWQKDSIRLGIKFLAKIWMKGTYFQLKIWWTLKSFTSSMMIINTKNLLMGKQSYRQSVTMYCGWLSSISINHSKPHWRTQHLKVNHLTEMNTKHI